MARFDSGRSGSVISASHVFAAMPLAKSFGSKVGTLARARISPLRGSSITADPL